MALSCSIYTSLCCLLAVVFLPIIERELREYMAYWNTHMIRSSRLGNCLGGIPEDLFSMPAYYGMIVCKMYYDYNYS